MDSTTDTAPSEDYGHAWAEFTDNIHNLAGWEKNEVFAAGYKAGWINALALVIRTTPRANPGTPLLDPVQECLYCHTRNTIHTLTCPAYSNSARYGE